MNYLKDVSTVLVIVSAIRTRNTTQHLQAERQMLRLIFAFDHINDPVLIHSNMHFSEDNAQAFDISLNVDLELHLQVKLLVQFISYRALQQKK